MPGLLMKEGRVVTAGNAILPGVTRATLIRALAEAQLTVDERAFRLEEAYCGW